MRLTVFIILLSVFCNSKLVAQENLDGILRNFNYIEYYPDSTIKRAMYFTDLESDGFCVEFDSLGNPISIGEYRSWKRIGIWWNSDGSMTNYHDYFEFVRGFPGCGTGKLQNIEQFNELYEQLTR